MNRPLRPADLPPDWYELWDERSAIMMEGGNIPADLFGRKTADRLAFADIVLQMEKSGCFPRSLYT